MLIRRILVLCLGNVCRSPMAEVLLRARLGEQAPGIAVRSAGLQAPVGEPAAADALAIAAAHGLDIAGHRSRQLDPEMLRWAELVLVMEKAQREALIAADPSVSGKVFLLGHWSGEEIDDPYLLGREAFEVAFDAIERGVHAWSRRLAGAP